LASPNDAQTPPSGCFANAAGCLVAVVILPFSLVPAAWLAFAMGPMGCTLPNNCSKGEEVFKGIVSLVIFAGGGLGVPLAAGVLAQRSIKTTQMNAVNRARPSEDNISKNQ